MFFWTIKWCITSFILISFIHYFYDFFKNKFTKQKVYNILDNNAINQDNSINNNNTKMIDNNDTTMIDNNDTTMIDNIDTTMIDNIDTTMIDTTMIDNNNGEMKEELLNFINILKNDT